MSLLSGFAFSFSHRSGLLWLVKVALMGLVLPGQDKWRNLHVMASGWGSRHRGKIVSKSAQPTPKHDDNTLVSYVGENDIEILDVKPLASTGTGDVLKDVGTKKPLSRLLSHRSLRSSLFKSWIPCN